MRPEVAEGLKSLLLEFNNDTSNVDIELSLMDFCSHHGAKVHVGLHHTSGMNGNKVRHFLLGFGTTAEAINFACDISTVTYGFTGVMIDVASITSAVTHGNL